MKQRLEVYANELIDVLVSKTETSAQNEKTRYIINEVYKSISNSDRPSTQDMKESRSKLMQLLKNRPDWPIDQLTNKKVGYQKGMKIGSAACIAYNRIQAIIGLDINDYAVCLDRNTDK